MNFGETNSAHHDGNEGDRVERWLCWKKIGVVMRVWRRQLTVVLGLVVNP